jgi:hypothetical protein
LALAAGGRNKRQKKIVAATAKLPAIARVFNFLPNFIKNL